MMATFKSAALKMQFSVGMKDDKELKKTIFYNNVNEKATEQQIVDFKKSIEALSSNKVLISELVTTKTL